MSRKTQTHTQTSLKDIIALARPTREGYFIKKAIIGYDWRRMWGRLHEKRGCEYAVYDTTSLDKLGGKHYVVLRGYDSQTLAVYLISKERLVWQKQWPTELDRDRQPQKRRVRAAA